MALSNAKLGGDDSSLEEMELITAST